VCIVCFQEAEKKRKIEKLKQKRWQEKHRRFMFGLGQGDEEPHEDDRDTLQMPLGGGDRRMSRRPSSLFMPHDEPRGTGGSVRSDTLSLAQFLPPTPEIETKKKKKSKSRTTDHDVDEYDAGSDSSSGSPGSSIGAEGAYDLLREATTEPPPYSDDDVRSLAVPIIVPVRTAEEETFDDADKSEDEPTTRM
jgi:hypothetical protein